MKRKIDRDEEQRRRCRLGLSVSPVSSRQLEDYGLHRLGYSRNRLKTSAVDADAVSRRMVRRSSSMNIMRSNAHLTDHLRELTAPV